MRKVTLSDQSDQPTVHPLRALRKAKGWTVRKLSNRSNVPLSTILGIETGGRRANPTTAGKLAKALGVSPADVQSQPKPGTHPLRVARLAKGLTIHTLAKRSGVSVYKIDLIELGNPEAPVDLTTATALEAALDIPTGSIFGPAKISAKQPSIHPLRRARHAKGWTLHQLAKLSKVSYATVQVIETWRASRTSIWVAIDLGETLGMDPSELFDSSEIQTPRNNTTHPLRRARKGREWTIAELGEYSGVPAEVIWRIEVYYPDFTADNMTQMRLSRTLQVNVEVLFDPDDIFLSRRPIAGRSATGGVHCPSCHMLTLPGPSCRQCDEPLAQPAEQPPHQEGEI